MLVRVFEIPPPTGNFHFGKGEPQAFIEVDWFRDDEAPKGFEFHLETGRSNITEWIKKKRYYRTDTAYLILHPTDSFTINYKAP